LSAWAWSASASCTSDQWSPISPVSAADPLAREKLLKLDARAREYNITVVGEEKHVAYNRVGLTTFFEHRKVEKLYLNPLDWVCPPLVYPVNKPTPPNPHPSTRASSTAP
jgi:hypothetical protein